MVQTTYCAKRLRKICETYFYNHVSVKISVQIKYNIIWQKHELFAATTGTAPPLESTH